MKDTVELVRDLNWRRGEGRGGKKEKGEKAFALC